MTRQLVSRYAPRMQQIKKLLSFAGEPMTPKQFASHHGYSEEHARRLLAELHSIDSKVSRSLRDNPNGTGRPTFAYSTTA